MKKTTLFLLTTLSIFTCITGMEMEVEECNTHNSSNTSEQNNASHIKSSNQTDKLLKENNALLKDLVVLTRTKIVQDKIHFEYEDDKKYTTHVTINQHAKNTQTALDDLYNKTNAQLKNKALHIPITGQTTSTTTQTKKSSKTEDII